MKRQKKFQKKKQKENLLFEDILTTFQSSSCYANMKCIRRADDPENYLAPITRKDALNVLAVQHKITKLLKVNH